MKKHSVLLGALLSLQPIAQFWEQMRHAAQIKRAKFESLFESLRRPKPVTPPTGGTNGSAKQFRFGSHRHTLAAHEANLLRCQGHTKDSARIIAGLVGKPITKKP